MNIEFSEVLNRFEPTCVAEVVIGYDKNGNVYSHKFLKSNSLYVAGTTGSGKSIKMHEMILSGMFHNNPSEIQFTLYDPKQVEYATYQKSPFINKDVIIDREEFKNHLIELEEILEERIRLFKEVKAKDIEEYNEYLVNKEFEKLPYLITVVDEIVEFSIGKSEMIKSLNRLIYKARAYGIYFIISTQTPRSEVVSDSLRDSMACIALMTSNVTESMNIIGEPGAEVLEPRGQMIYKHNGEKKTLQTSFVSDDNIKDLCDYFKSKYSF